MTILSLFLTVLHIVVEQLFINFLIFSQDLRRSDLPTVRYRRPVKRVITRGTSDLNINSSEIVIETLKNCS